MSRERIDLPLDREMVLTKYDELEQEVGLSDPVFAAPRIGVAVDVLEKYLRSRVAQRTRKPRRIGTV